MDPLARCSWDRFSSLSPCRLDYPDEQYFMHFEVLPFEIRQQGSFSDTEISFSFDFSEVCCDVFGS